jgi:hypothetical protein
MLLQHDSSGNLAIKLLRTYATLMETLQRYRGKGEQKVVVEHVHVHEGGQAIVGNVHQVGGPTKTEERPHQPSLMNRAPRCLARTRSGKPCQSPAVNGKRRCRMHGGAAGSGAREGNQNALRHGHSTAQAIAWRREMRELLRAGRMLATSL